MDYLEDSRNRRKLCTLFPNNTKGFIGGLSVADVVLEGLGYGMIYHAGKKTGKTDHDVMVEEIVAAVEAKAAGLEI